VKRRLKYTLDGQQFDIALKDLPTYDLANG
jgi:hypothetical protein